MTIKKKRGKLSKHTRSPEAQERRLQRREARRIVQKFAFNDFIVSESINRLTPEQIENYVNAVLPEGVIYHFATSFERGEVITDSRGRGSIQT